MMTGSLAMGSDVRGLHVAVLGECLVELTGSPFGTLHQSFGGDTLNTALYLSRLCASSAAIHYVTVLGNDSLSGTMVDRWREAGIHTEYTLRDPSRLPGLYQIQVDSQGERSFLYWREESAARYLLRHPEFVRVRNALEHADLIYVSAISLAILPPEDRGELIALLSTLARRGAYIAYDTNYRARLWSSPDAARRCNTALLAAASLVFATYDDERQLWGDTSPEATAERYRTSYRRLLVIKSGAAGCLYANGVEMVHVPTTPVRSVVDTTAAGDSFNAAFLAARLSGQGPQSACTVANALAGLVIQYPGAIIPESAMPSLQALTPPSEAAS